MTRSRSSADPEKILAFAIEAARSLEDDKCSDITLLDVRGLSQICDYVLICSGTSERQMRSGAQALEDLGEAHGSPPWKTSGDDGTTWVVVDFVELVVHLFEPQHRLYYDIESLWGESRRVEWARDESHQRPIPRGGHGE